MKRSDKNILKAEQIKQANKMVDALTDEEDLLREKYLIWDEARQIGKSSMSIQIGKYILEQMEKKKSEAVKHEREMHRLLSKLHRGNTKFK